MELICTFSVSFDGIEVPTVFYGFTSAEGEYYYVAKPTPGYGLNDFEIHFNPDDLIFVTKGEIPYEVQEQANELGDAISEIEDV